MPILNCKNPFLDVHADKLQTREMFLGYAWLTGSVNHVTFTLRGFENRGRMQGGFGLDFLRYAN